MLSMCSFVWRLECKAVVRQAFRHFSASICEKDSVKKTPLHSPIDVRHAKDHHEYSD